MKFLALIVIANICFTFSCPFKNLLSNQDLDDIHRQLSHVIPQVSNALPTSGPTVKPSQLPSNLPSAKPTRIPTAVPSRKPNSSPTAKPTLSPSKYPTAKPTVIPIASFPTSSPSAVPSSSSPTSAPSRMPIKVPSAKPTRIPTFYPSSKPTMIPTSTPSLTPTKIPVFTPSAIPSSSPTTTPSSSPTSAPSRMPIKVPSAKPTRIPTFYPSSKPTMIPTSTPSLTPTKIPVFTPSAIPSSSPTSNPTSSPSASPTNVPSSVLVVSSRAPSRMPSKTPSKAPKTSPTSRPSKSPTVRPTTATPTRSPTFVAGVCGLTAPGTRVFTTDADITDIDAIITSQLQGVLNTNDPFIQSNLFGAAVRLSFHDAGEYDQSTGDRLGSDGCLSNSSENRGLVEPNALVNTVIEPLWQSVCDRISRADFWVLYAKRVVEMSEPTDSISIPYHYGRPDSYDCNEGIGRLPGGQNGLDEFRRVFVNQMGLTLSDGVTLLGAHTLGHVHNAVSGFGHVIPEYDYAINYTINAFDLTPHQFDNSYFNLLIAKPWRSHNPVNRSDLTFWSMLGGKEIMLPVDISLVFPLNLDVNPVTGTKTGKVGEICRSAAAFALTDGEGDPAAFSVQCSNTAGDSNIVNTVIVGGYTFIPGPIATTDPPETEIECEEYVVNNDSFLNAFADAFSRMTTVGFDIPGGSVGGKLGSLFAYLPLNTTGAGGGGGGSTDDDV